MRLAPKPQVVQVETIVRPMGHLLSRSIRCTPLTLYIHTVSGHLDEFNLNLSIFRIVPFVSNFLLTKSLK